MRAQRKAWCRFEIYADRIQLPRERLSDYRRGQPHSVGVRHPL
nr:MAG TPA: hypothetical protein [Bacteriophage sp.]